MKTKLSKKQIKACEDTGWSVASYGRFSDGSACVELETSSSLGEDFILTVGIEDFANDLSEQYENFDPEEHAINIYLAARDGVMKDVPTTSIRALLKDADEIDDMILNLAQAAAQAV